ncbi:MAG: hypothetical protein D6741_03270, partial [Planctomycetota bacterium]
MTKKRSRYRGGLVAFVGAIVLVGLAGRAVVAQSTADRAIWHSDVVFMYDNPDRYAEYGCTVLGWAGRADAEHIRRAHEAGVRLFTTSVGFLTEFRRVIDFTPDFMDAACRNFAGEPFIVPWLWDHKYKGQPAWWWCTNSPVYRRYLYSRLDDVAASGADGLHIDDYAGTSAAVTWRSACFCRYCMAGFRKYLKENASQEKLKSLGIDDLDSFDYRQFLIDRGVTPDDYRRKRGSLPLADEFLDFQVKANVAFVAAYHREACRRAGRKLTLSVNSGLGAPMRLAVAPYLSYFCCEIPHNAADLSFPRHPIYIYKLADALGKPVAATASGQDWALINAENRTALVRSWTALSYAMGHNFMAPQRQWCYTPEKGTHWYDGPTDEYAYVYRFVREHATLLDGYEAAASVAVVYGSEANRKGKGRIEPICIELAQRNVPFDVVIAGDDWLPDQRLSREIVARYEAVIVPDGLVLDSAQQAVLDALGEKVVSWSDRDRLFTQLSSPIQIVG